MNAAGFSASCLFALALLAAWLYLIDPSQLMDKPINLQDHEYAEDFGRFVQTLPADQQAKLGAYLDRADDGRLLPGELSWYEAEVTPYQIINEINAN